MQCPFSGSSDVTLVQTFTAPPEGETLFGFPTYLRKLWCFPASGHYVNTQQMTVDYTGGYVASTYKDLEGVRRRYAKIRGLPSGKSDNAGRVKNIINTIEPTPTLDIGSGLGVFPAALRDEGWPVTALDPDATACDHLRELSLDVICGDVMTATVEKKFGLVTINKVLEHVQDPIEMLLKAKGMLSESGLIYIEVPDGEMAIHEGAERQEFFIEHWHAFSFRSLVMMIEQSGLKLVSVERLREPSMKFTLRAIARKNQL